MPAARGAARTSDLTSARIGPRSLTPLSSVGTSGATYMTSHFFSRFASVVNASRARRRPNIRSDQRADRTKIADALVIGRHIRRNIYDIAFLQQVRVGRKCQPRAAPPEHQI